MSVGDQIGARIREKRVQLRIRQSQLAKIVGVSPSYLNLIEHNRRRIGGKLLTDLAEALAIDVDLLSEDRKILKSRPLRRSLRIITKWTCRLNPHANWQRDFLHGVVF